MNINPEAVVLPINDCMEIRNLISDLLKRAQINKENASQIADSSGVTVSKGITDLAGLLKDF